MKNQGVISPDQLRENLTREENAFIVSNNSVLQNLKFTQDRLFPDNYRYKYPKNTRAQISKIYMGMASPGKNIPSKKMMNNKYV